MADNAPGVDNDKKRTAGVPDEGVAPDAKRQRRESTDMGPPPPPPPPLEAGEQIGALSSLALIEAVDISVLENKRYADLSDEQREQVMSVIDAAIPLNFLDESQVQFLLDHSSFVTYPAKSVIVKDGDRNDVGLYVVLEGIVHFVTKPKRADDTARKSLGTGGKAKTFGTRSTVLGRPHSYTVRAEVPSKLMIVPTEVYKALLGMSKALSFATAMYLQTQKLLFVSVRRLRRLIDNGVLFGGIDMDDLLPLYTKIRPALHPRLFEYEIDVGAWSYAIRRLPETLTTTACFLLSTNHPMYMTKPLKYLQAVETVARRRLCFDFQNGKTFVLLRDAATDVIDFVTCLCCHVIEARKLRHRLGTNKLVADLHPVLKAVGPAGETEEVQRQLLSPYLTADEIKSLRKIWPTTLLQQCWNIIFHHENYTISIDRSLNMSSTPPSALWISRIRAAATSLLGDDLDTCDVAIISSNTHSVVNLVSPYIRQHHDEMLAWAAEKYPGLMDADFKNDEDRLYFVAHKYFSKFPERNEERLAEEREAGITYVTENEYTGINVNLIDANRLGAATVDSYVTLPTGDDGQPRGGRRLLIVNIDYSFGQQAEAILGNLILLFGKQIVSINVLGKAGSLVGARGDILMPSHVLSIDQEEELRPVSNFDLDPKLIMEISGRCVHQGVVLTVLGTLMQNRELLHYYKNLWACIGLEMEGSYYARQIERTIMYGLLDENVVTRFLYYVSDLPLDLHSNLSLSLKPWEGIPPLYAVTRVILNRILTCEPRKMTVKVPMTPSRLNLLERSDFIIDDNSAGGDNNTSTSS